MEVKYTKEKGFEFEFTASEALTVFEFIDKLIDAGVEAYDAGEKIIDVDGDGLRDSESPEESIGATAVMTWARIIEMASKETAIMSR